MNTWLIAVLVAIILLAVISLAGWLVLRKLSTRARRLGDRIKKLPLGAKIRLATRLAGDERLPVGIRLVPLFLAIYLVLPIDIIPDFIPVVGQLDDILVVVLGLGLIVRFSPAAVIESHLAALEAEVEVRSSITSGGSPGQR